MFKSKFLKNRRRESKNYSYKGNNLCYGNYGLKSLSWGRITSNQIEAGRKVITKSIRKGGKMWIRVFPDRSFTKKPVDTRMGNGKGDISFYIFIIKPGRIIYEILGLSESLSFNILKAAAFKLPIKTIVIF